MAERKTGLEWTVRSLWMGGHTVRPVGIRCWLVMLTPSGFMLIYERGLIKETDLDNTTMKEN